MRLLVPLLCLTWTSCARTWINYPPEVVVGDDGVSRSVASRAVELNGSDSLGRTTIRVTRNSVEFTTEGGIDNSTSTKEGYRTVRYGIAAAGTAAGTYFAYQAYLAQQAASSASNVAASRASGAAAVSRNATTVRLAEIEAAGRAIPAAGSTIQATTPAVVTPVP